MIWANGKQRVGKPKLLEGTYPTPTDPSVTYFFFEGRQQHMRGTDTHTLRNALILLDIDTHVHEEPTGKVASEEAFHLVRVN